MNLFRLKMDKYIKLYINMIIKLFTMVKNENDIIEHWIKYHGNI